MVWIHGGQNVWGRSGMYDGSTLALREDVIVVIPQYRVGLLGWFAHPALRANVGTPEDGAASFAILEPDRLIGVGRRHHPRLRWRPGLRDDIRGELRRA